MGDNLRQRVLRLVVEFLNHALFSRRSVQKSRNRSFDRIKFPAEPAGEGLLFVERKSPSIVVEKGDLSQGLLREIVN
jgi:hypothetical protein